jgi:hypothetical protein
MTVKELIRRLEKVAPDKEIGIEYVTKGYFGNTIMRVSDVTSKEHPDLVIIKAVD